MRGSIAWLWILLAAALSGCEIYGYQPNTLRVPTVDTAGRVEVAATVGTGGFILPQYNVQAQAIVLKSFIVGGQGSLYRQYDSFLYPSRDFKILSHPTLETPGESDGFRDYRRKGASAGLTLGKVFHTGENRLFIQAGVDWEDVERSYRQVEFAWKDSLTGKIEDRDRLNIQVKATYVKPWLQLGGRVCGSRRGRRLQNRTDFVYAGRVGGFLPISRTVHHIDLNGRLNNGEDLALPNRFGQAQADMMFGLELCSGHLTTSLRTQLSLINTDDDWLHTPGLTFNFGLAYQFGRKATYRPRHVPLQPADPFRYNGPGFWKRMQKGIDDTFPIPPPSKPKLELPPIR